MLSEKVNNLTKDTKGKFEKTIEWFSNEVSSLRGGRISTNLVEDVKIDYYRTQTPLKALASLSMLDSATISIEPWDKSSLQNIERALYDTEFGGNVKQEGNRILFNLPVLTEEDKQKIVKVLKEKTEEAKIRLREARDKSWKEVQKMEKGGEVTEDEKFEAKEELQKLIDEFNEKIEGIEAKKEKELSSV